MKYTKDVFRFTKLPYSDKNMLIDYGIDYNTAKTVEYNGKTVFELYPIGKIGMYAIADLWHSTILVIPAIISLYEMIYDNNFGEQYDEYGAVKAIGAAVGSGSALVGLLATKYFMRQKADYIVNKLAIRFTDSETKMYLGEIDIISNYRTKSLDELMAYLNGRLKCLGEVGDFIQFETNNMSVEQVYCVGRMRDSEASYNSIREMIRAMRIELVRNGLDPNANAKEVLM